MDLRVDSVLVRCSQNQHDWLEFTWSPKYGMCAGISYKRETSHDEGDYEIMMTMGKLETLIDDLITFKEAVKVAEMHKLLGVSDVQ